MRYPCLVVDHDDTVVNSTATVHYPCFVEYTGIYHPEVHYTLEEYIKYNFDPGVVAFFCDIIGMSRAETERLREKLKGLLEERNLVHRHLLSAFPRLSQTEYRAAFERIQEHRKNLSEKVKNKANEIRENK